MEDFLQQHALLSNLNLSRAELKRDPDPSATVLKVAVLRNHSFELVASTIDAFLHLSGYQSHFLYSDYDDSFSLTDIASDAELILIWADLDRYDAEGCSILLKRFSDLAGADGRPVLLAPVTSTHDIDRLSENLSPNLFLVEMARIQNELGATFFDERLASFTGTRCSPRACVEASRLIGASSIPAKLLPPLKAVIVDLDNTLYAGVLGEDGIEGVTVTPAHLALQTAIENLAAHGFFVCVVSKNELQDAEDLFMKRSDFTLKRKSITKLLANWRPKSENIAELEKVLNIHHSAMLFIDDNVGELFEVHSAFPEIKVLWASPDSEANARAIDLYPGLHRKKAITDEDAIRSLDIQANEERQRRRLAMSPQEYLRSLDIEITFGVDQPKDAERVAELARKTNQFIFNYRRYSLGEITEAIESGNTCVVTASMSDKLVNSGIIAAAVVERRDTKLVVDELFVSCRALGRALDEIIILGMVSLAQAKLGQTLPIQINFQDGPRNGPAKSFVETHFSGHRHAPEIFQYAFPTSLIRIRTPAGEFL